MSSLREETIFHLLEVIWDNLDGVRILVRSNNGASAMVLCRSLFEKCCAAHYLLNSDDQVIQDYRDYGVVVAYELGEALHAPAGWLGKIKQRYDEVKPRFVKGNRGVQWHGGNVRTLINAADESEIGTDLAGLYKTFYKEASSIAHGDSFLVSQYDPDKGWYQELPVELLTQYAETALLLSYRFTCDVFHHYNQKFTCGFNGDIMAADDLLLKVDAEWAVQSSWQA